MVYTVSAQDDGIVEGTESFGVVMPCRYLYMFLSIMIHIHGLHWLVLSDLSIGFQEAYYTVSESAGVIELTVSPDGTGGSPDVGVPLGVRITSRDGSAKGTAFVCVCGGGGGGGGGESGLPMMLFYTTSSWERLPWCGVYSLHQSPSCQWFCGTSKYC